MNCRLGRSLFRRPTARPISRISPASDSSPYRAGSTYTTCVISGTFPFEMYRLPVKRIRSSGMSLGMGAGALASP